MKRREFLKTGAALASAAGAAGVAGLGAASCGGGLSGTRFGDGSLPLPDMKSFIQRVDEGLSQIADWSLYDRFASSDVDLHEEDGLLRTSWKSIYLAGMFGDLPDEGQMHPGMQQRVLRAMPEMDDAVFGVANYLSRVSDEDAREVQRFLRRESNPGMEIAEWLDGKESTAWVSARRRVQTRSLLTQVVSRMRNQSPKTVLDDYVGRTRKAAAKAGSVAEVQRQIIAQTGERAFWERQQRLAMLAAQWDEREGAVADAAQYVELAEPDAGVAPVAPASDPDSAPGAAEDTSVVTLTPDQLIRCIEEQTPRFEPVEDRVAELRSQKLKTAGSWTLGIGAALSGLTALAFVVEFPAGMIFGALGTIGVLMLIAGAVIFIVRAMMD